MGEDTTYQVKYGDEINYLLVFEIFYSQKQKQIKLFTSVVTCFINQIRSLSYCRNELFFSSSLPCEIVSDGCFSFSSSNNICLPMQEHTVIPRPHDIRVFARLLILKYSSSVDGNQLDVTVTPSFWDPFKSFFFLASHSNRTCFWVCISVFLSHVASRKDKSWLSQLLLSNTLRNRYPG